MLKVKDIVVLEILNKRHSNWNGIVAKVVYVPSNPNYCLTIDPIYLPPSFIGTDPYKYWKESGANHYPHMSFSELDMYKVPEQLIL